MSKAAGAEERTKDTEPSSEEGEGDSSGEETEEDSKVAAAGRQQSDVDYESSVSASEDDEGDLEDVDDLEDESDDDVPHSTLEYHRLTGSTGLGMQLPEDSHIICMAAHEKVLVVGTDEGYVYVLDLFGNEVLKLRPHKSPINCLALDHTGEWLASCSNDNEVLITNMFTGKAQKTHTFLAPQLCVAFPQTAEFADKPQNYVSGGRTNTISWTNKGTLWGYKSTRLHTGEGCIYTIRWHGNYLAWANELGVKIYDWEQRRGVAFLPRDLEKEHERKVVLGRTRAATMDALGMTMAQLELNRPEEQANLQSTEQLYRPHLCWLKGAPKGTPPALAIGWGYAVTVVQYVKKKNGKAKFRILFSYRMDFLIAGISFYDPARSFDLLLLTCDTLSDGLDADTVRLQTKVVTRKKELVAVDTIPGIRRVPEMDQPANYGLQDVDGDHSRFYITTPRELLLVQHEQKLPDMVAIKEKMWTRVASVSEVRRKNTITADSPVPELENQLSDQCRLIFNLVTNGQYKRPMDMATYLRLEYPTYGTVDRPHTEAQLKKQHSVWKSAGLNDSSVLTWENFVAVHRFNYYGLGTPSHAVHVDFMHKSKENIDRYIEVVHAEFETACRNLFSLVLEAGSRPPDNREAPDLADMESYVRFESLSEDADDFDARQYLRWEQAENRERALTTWKNFAGRAASKDLTVGQREFTQLTYRQFASNGQSNFAFFLEECQEKVDNFRGNLAEVNEHRRKK